MLWRAVTLVSKRLLSAVLAWYPSTHSQAGQRVCLHGRWFARLASSMAKRLFVVRGNRNNYTKV
jgi:hypothetical protein